MIATLLPRGCALRSKVASTRSRRPAGIKLRRRCCDLAIIRDVIMRGLKRFDLYQAIVKRRRSSHIGERVAARELVGVLAVTGKLFPPNRQGHDDSRAGTIGDSGAQLDTAAVIEDPHIAIRDHAPPGSVVRMDVQ